MPPCCTHANKGVYAPLRVCMHASFLEPATSGRCCPTRLKRETAAVKLSATMPACLHACMHALACFEQAHCVLIPRLPFPKRLNRHTAAAKLSATMHASSLHGCIHADACLHASTQLACFHYLAFCLWHSISVLLRLHLPGPRASTACCLGGFCP